MLMFYSNFREPGVLHVHHEGGFSIVYEGETLQRSAGGGRLPASILPRTARHETRTKGELHFAVQPEPNAVQPWPIGFVTFRYSVVASFLAGVACDKEVNVT